MNRVWMTVIDNQLDYQKRQHCHIWCQVSDLVFRHKLEWWRDPEGFVAHIKGASRIDLTCWVQHDGPMTRQKK